jgi:hypothetical protein
VATNLALQYLKAEARYQAAKTPEEELAGLEEMWREFPKHKSSEKIQADLKKKVRGAQGVRAERQEGPRPGHLVLYPELRRPPDRPDRHAERR